MPIAVGPPVSVLRDPSPDEVTSRLRRGPLVVVTPNATLLATLVSAGGTHGWALVPPDASAGAIEAAARAAEAGLVVLPVAIAHEVRAARARPDTRERASDEEDQVEPLTPREREVLQHVAQGLHNRAIALSLGISDHTVKFHLASIFGKLGASTRTEAVRVGLRRGLVQI